MRKIKYILCFAAVIFSISATAFTTLAYSPQEIEEQIDIGSFIDSLPEDAKQYLPPNIKNNKSIIEASQNTDTGFITKLLSDILKKLIPTAVVKISSLLGLIIAVAIVNSIKNNISTPGYSKAITYVTMAVISVFIYSMIADLWSDTQLFFNSMSTVLNSLIPIMTLLYTMGGNASTAIVNSSGIAILLSVINSLINTVIFPLVEVCFGLTVAGSVGNLKGVSQITKTVKNTFTVILAGIVTVFSIFLLFKTNLSVSADGAAARTIKFAGSFIPVIGSALGEAVRSLMSGLSLIKSSVGFVGIIIILVTTLPTLLNITATKFCMDISAITASLLDCEKESTLLRDFSGLLGFFIAITFCVSILFVFELTVFVTISPALGAN